MIMAEYINREEAIEAAKHAWEKGLEPSQYIEIIPSADVSPVRHGEWIPVTERLPEESGMYIVTANDGHAQRVSFVQWQKKNRMWNLTGARSYWRVTHWQPLPQPPKGE